MPMIYTPAASAASLVASSAASSFWFSPGSLSFELLKALPTILIAVFVAYVAYQQLQVARSQRRLAQEKVRLDLFADRLRVYRVLSNFLGSAQALGDRELQHAVGLVQDAGVEAFFLFGPNIGKVYQDAISAAIELQFHMERLRTLELGTKEHDETSAEVMAFMLDTNVFNAIVDGKLELDKIASGGEFFATHVQLDELRACPSPRRELLVAQFHAVAPIIVPTETMVWGVSAWDAAKWGEGTRFSALKAALDGKNNGKRNNVKDALIGEAAIVHGYTLITSDRDLADVVLALGGQTHGFPY